MNTKKWTALDLVQIALVAALYVALTLTPPLNAIAYGAYQFRVSEMLNFLAFYNPKCIIAVTIGCMIANFYSFELIDVLLMSPIRLINDEYFLSRSSYNSSAIASLRNLIEPIPL